jgi:hypothetical protein
MIALAVRGCLECLLGHLEDGNIRVGVGSFAVQPILQPQKDV